MENCKHDHSLGTIEKDFFRFSQKMHVGSETESLSRRLSAIYNARPLELGGRTKCQGEASPGPGLVFGVQAERGVDFAGPLSPASGFLGLLLGSADQVGDAVGAGKPKGRTEFPVRAQPSSDDTAMQPCLDQEPCFETPRTVSDRVRSHFAEGHAGKAIRGHTTTRRVGPSPTPVECPRTPQSGSREWCVPVTRNVRVVCPRKVHPRNVPKSVPERPVVSLACASGLYCRQRQTLADSEERYALRRLVSLACASGLYFVTRQAMRGHTTTRRVERSPTPVECARTSSLILFSHIWVALP